MATLKYSNCLVQKPGPFIWELQRKTAATEKEPLPGIKATHLMTADETVQAGFFSVDCTWLWNGAARTPIGESHTHDFSHVIGFIGGHPADPHDLGGEITVWLDGHQEVFTRSCLIFVPAGVVHGPFLFSKIERPVFFIAVAMTGEYATTSATPPEKPSAEKRYSIIDHTKEKFSVGGDFKDVPLPKSTVKSSRILHIEDDMVKGSFYIDFVWIWEGTGGATAPEHGRAPAGEGHLAAGGAQVREGTAGGHPPGDRPAAELGRPASYVVKPHRAQRRRASIGCLPDSL